MQRKRIVRTIGKSLLLSALALSGVSAGAALPPAEPDFGGVTFDFRKISEERFKIPHPGDPGDLIGASPWRGGGYCSLHHQKAKLDAKRLEKVRKTVVWRQADGICRIEKPSALKDAAGTFEGKALAEFISGGFTKFVVLPDACGGDFRLSFRYKARHSLGQHSYYLIYFKRRDPSTGGWIAAKNADGLGFTAYPLKDEWSGWNVFSRNVQLPPGCEAVELIMRIDGIGDLLFRDVTLVKSAAEKDGVTLIPAPHDALGCDFALSRGQAAGIGFSIRKNTKRNIDPFKCRFRLELPAGVDFIGASFGDMKSVTKTELPGGGTETVFAPTRAHWFQFDGSFATWNRMIVLVRTGLPAGSAGYAKLDFLSPEGRRLSKTASVKLSVIGAVKARKPARYMNGISTAGDSTRFHDAAADGAFARLMGDCGVDWLICCNFSHENLALWRSAGIRRITPTGQPANGYYMTRNWKNRPAADRFVADAPCRTFGTKYDDYIARATCPFAVIEEREFFMADTVKEMAKFLEGTDGMWANWEPYMFKGRGCGCAICKAKFKVWHGKTGGSLADFRSKTHGELIRVIDRHVRAATGGERSLGFIPGISWREMASVWRSSDPSPESRPIDYAGDLKWINPWGPYVGWNPKMPFAKQKRAPLAHFIAAADLRAQTDRDFPAGRRPKLMAFPHGMQDLNWVTQPEHLEMGLDSFFFNGWEASVVYFFPQGLDARFWRAFANATTRSAKCEAFVLDGVSADSKCRLKSVSEYASPCRYVTAYLPQYRNEPMLRHKAFDLSGSRMIAVFNFWDEGPAFFRLEADALPEGNYTITDEDGVRFLNRGGASTYSAAELRLGVPLMVGAARTKAFFIRPDVMSDGAVLEMTAERLENFYRRRRATLFAAAQEDARSEQANAVTVDKTAEL